MKRDRRAQAAHDRVWGRILARRVYRRRRMELDLVEEVEAGVLVMPPQRRREVRAERRD